MVKDGEQVLDVGRFIPGRWRLAVAAPVSSNNGAGLLEVCDHGCPATAVTYARMQQDDYLG